MTTDSAPIPSTATAQVGVLGLAVMGRNLARNLARHGYTVAVHNRTPRPHRRADRRARRRGHVRAGRDRRGVRRQPGAAPPGRDHGQGRRRHRRGDRRAGPAARGAGDIIVDGGNAHFADTRRREAALREHRPALRRHRRLRRRGGRAATGPASCPAARPSPTPPLGPMLENIAAQVDGVPCCTHVGPDGAGHFVKMVHNGIEYADMQLIAEAYDLLRQGLGATPAEIAEIFAEWNAGDLESFLIEITAEVLAHVDAETGQPFVDVVARPGRAEGHRPLDRAERPRPRRPGHRHRRGRPSPAPLSGYVAAARGRRRGASGQRRHVGGHATATRSSRTSARPCTPPRSSRTRRASTRSPPASAGVRLEHRPRRHGHASGAAAASSAPGSSTGSARPTSAEPDLPTAARRPVLRRGRRRRRRRPGGGSWPRPRWPACPTPAFSSSLGYYDGLRARAPARRAHPGPARLLRRAHLPARRRARHLPHPVGRRPHRDRGLTCPAPSPLPGSVKAEPGSGGLPRLVVYRTLRLRRGLPAGRARDRHGHPRAPTPSSG